MFMARLCRLLLAIVIGITTPLLRAQEPAASATVDVEMKNVDYHFTDPMVVHIAFLYGKLVPRASGKPPIFDDKESFTLAVDAAELSITPASLSRVLNDHVFSTPDAPLKKLVATIENGHLKLKGTMHKGVDLPFETESTMEATPEGLIRLHPVKVKAAHLPAKGFMDLFGVELSDLINTKHARGIKIDGNDILLQPDQLFPPPRIEGKVTAVRIARDRIVQQMGNAKERGIPKTSGNYMAYRGNKLQFGKLLMSDTDLRLIDMDPRDPFDFSLDHYKDQLMAGYSKTTATFGLNTFMKDYGKLHTARSANQASAAGSASR